MTFKQSKPVQPIIAFHRETNHLFCSSKQMAGFYIKRNTGLKWLNSIFSKYFEQLWILFTASSDFKNVLSTDLKQMTVTSGNLFCKNYTRNKMLFRASIISNWRHKSQISNSNLYFRNIFLIYVFVSICEYLLPVLSIYNLTLLFPIPDQKKK